MEHEHEINLAELPESCISAILSFTTPRDIWRLSAVCKVFRSAAYDDSLWDKFIPEQFYQIVPRAVNPIGPLSPKRELYIRLCDSILIDGGRKRFWLDRSTGKIGYMLSARELDIAWGNDERYWRWVPRADSSFQELAELKSVCWLDIMGEIDCTLLSRDVEYRVLYVLKFGRRSNGWDARPIKFSVTTPEGEHMESEEVLMNGGGQMEVANDGWKEGWMEVLAGQLRVTADSTLISFSMSEKESNLSKGGLLIDGVRIEPMPA